MDWESIKIRKFGSQTVAEKDADGFWKIVINMTEDVSFDGKEFLHKQLETMAIDKKFESGYAVALQSLYNKFEEETDGIGTMFKELVLGDKSTVNETPAT
jgi:hypothetical protein